MKGIVQLLPLEASDRERFIADNQEAFNFGAKEEFGLRDDHDEEEGKIISRETIAQSIDGGEAYRIVFDSKKVGGLVILTAVEKVAVNFGKPDQKGLDALTPAEARAYIAQGQFAPGSMLPKVEAAVRFAESKPGRAALITLLEKAKDGIEGRTGTRISQ